MSKNKTGLNKAIESIKNFKPKAAAKSPAKKGTEAKEPKKETKALEPKTEKTPAVKAAIVDAKGRAAATDDKSYKCGDVASLREGANARVIAEAFGKGKSVKDAVGDLELTFEAKRSKAAKNSLRSFVVGYVNHCVKQGFLTKV